MPLHLQPSGSWSTQRHNDRRPSEWGHRKASWRTQSLKRMNKFLSLSLMLATVCLPDDFRGKWPNRCFHYFHLAVVRSSDIFMSLSLITCCVRRWSFRRIHTDTKYEIELDSAQKLVVSMWINVKPIGILKFECQNSEIDRKNFRLVYFVAVPEGEGEGWVEWKSIAGSVPSSSSLYTLLLFVSCAFPNYYLLFMLQTFSSIV